MSGLLLARGVDPKYRPVFDALPDRDRAALASAFCRTARRGPAGHQPAASREMVLPIRRSSQISLGPSVLHQRVCGCEHKCEYCSPPAMSRERLLAEQLSRRPRQGLGWARCLRRASGLVIYPTAPTPCNLWKWVLAVPFALEKLAEQRHRFTTVMAVDEDPAMLLDERYVDVLLGSIAGERSSAKRISQGAWTSATADRSVFGVLERSASAVARCCRAKRQSQIEAIRLLPKEHLPVHLRIDPLFSRNLLPGGKKMEDFGLPDVQPLADLESLVRFCGEVGYERSHSLCSKDHAAARWAAFSTRDGADGNKFTSTWRRMALLSSEAAPGGCPKAQQRS